MPFVNRRLFLAQAATLAGVTASLPSFARSAFVDVDGDVDLKFDACRAAFATNFAQGLDVGASFHVTYQGESVVDLWGGWRDAAKTKKWKRNTIVNVFSTTKTMTALAALVLADRGELDLNAPVAAYWPEFAAAGKENVLVSHLMAHTAGLPGWDAPLSTEDLYDWEKATQLLAAQEAWWEPGSKSGYHALTQGYLIGEVVRRVTGQSLGTFFRKEIANPLDADFYIGTSARHDDRIAELIPIDSGARPIPPQSSPPSIAARVFANPAGALDDAANSEGWRRAEIPAANGHGNARSIARVQSVMANGGVFRGKRLLSEDGVRVALEEQVDGVDLVIGAPLRHGMGYGLDRGALFPRQNDETIFWGGYGGSVVIVDMKNSLCIAYAMNRLLPNQTRVQRTSPLIDAVYKAIA